MLKHTLMFWAVTVVGVLGTSWAIQSARAQNGQQIPIQPFTASIVINHEDGNGTVRSVEQVTEAFRSDKSSVRVKDALDNRPLGIKVIVDPNSGLRITADPLTGSTTAYHFRDKNPAIGPSRVDCGATSPPESEMLLGFKAVKVKTQYTFGARVVSSVEEWEAPDLGCFPLSRTSKLLVDGTVTAMNVLTTVAVKLGEPDVALFGIPPGYKERAPSEVFEEYSGRTGKSIPGTAGDFTGSALDQVYNSAQ